MSDRPEAVTRPSRLSWIWLIPLVAAAVAAYLAWGTISRRGPSIDITFRGGDGITAGQTRVRYKAVELGQVESVRLSDDASQVVVNVRMRQEAARFLTDHARFWVVRPRLSSGSLAGIETIVSGSYIEMDPGDPGGDSRRDFTGLETPPAVRSGEPGTTFRLQAQRLGSLSSGAPVFYRDIGVGEVLDYNLGNGLGPVTLTVFVRSPFDKFVRRGSRFWNASGLSVNFGADGLHLELASLQAVLNGGVAFNAPPDPNAPPAAANTQFELFADYRAAQNAGYTENQPFVAYFESSVRGLARGAAVEFFGIQVGTVQTVELQVDPNTARSRVKVGFDIQPQRVSTNNMPAPDDPVEVGKRLVANGMKVQVQSPNLLTGGAILALVFDPNTRGQTMQQEDGQWIVPSQPGGLDSVLASVTNLANKLSSLPVDEIGANLNATLRDAAGAMTSVSQLASRANAGLSPVFARLPTITAGLEQAMTHADRLFTSVDRSYGKDSDIQRELARAMVQVGDTARSIRLLADFLDRHPEALVRGRAGYATE